MHLKLPADYIDPATHAPLPDAVLVIADVELRWHRGDTRLIAQVYPNAALVGLAAAVSEYAIVLSLEERDSQRDAIEEAFYTIVAARPEYDGSEIITPMVVRRD